MKRSGMTGKGLPLVKSGLGNLHLFPRLPLRRSVTQWSDGERGVGEKEVSYRR
ncbi:MAG: hypothetical protein WC878_05195 [Candidatus Paceibacterota bacterium]